MISKNLDKFFILILFIALGVIYIYRAPLFKKEVKNEVVAISDGFGYYGPAVIEECITPEGKCSTTGTQRVVKTCIPNPRTGNGCINDEGYQDFNIQVEKRPCFKQCKASVLKERNINTCHPYITKTGVSFDQDCIPPEISGYKETYYDCVPFHSTGINACNYTCGSDFTVTTLGGMTGAEKYPNSECFAKNSNVNLLGPLINKEPCTPDTCINYEVNSKKNVTPEIFIYPLKCYNGDLLYVDMDVLMSPFVVGSDGTKRRACQNMTKGTEVTIDIGESILINTPCQLTNKCNTYYAQEPGPNNLLISTLIANAGPGSYNFQKDCGPPSLANFQPGFETVPAICSNKSGDYAQYFDPNHIYFVGDVFYRNNEDIGRPSGVELYLALESSTGKNPTLNSDVWQITTESASNSWVATDTYKAGDTVSYSYTIPAFFKSNINGKIDPSNEEDYTEVKNKTYLTTEGVSDMKCADYSPVRAYSSSDYYSLSEKVYVIDTSINTIKFYKYISTESANEKDPLTSSLHWSQIDYEDIGYVFGTVPVISTTYPAGILISYGGKNYITTASKAFTAIDSTYKEVYLPHNSVYHIDEDLSSLVSDIKTDTTQDLPYAIYDPTKNALDGLRPCIKYSSNAETFQLFRAKIYKDPNVTSSVYNTVYGLKFTPFSSGEIGINEQTTYNLADNYIKGAPSYKPQEIAAITVGNGIVVDQYSNEFIKEYGDRAFGNIGDKLILEQNLTNRTIPLFAEENMTIDTVTSGFGVTTSGTATTLKSNIVSSMTEVSNGLLFYRIPIPDTSTFTLVALFRNSIFGRVYWTTESPLSSYAFPEVRVTGSSATDAVGIDSPVTNVAKLYRLVFVPEQFSSYENWDKNGLEFPTVYTLYDPATDSVNVIEKKIKLFNRFRTSVNGIRIVSDSYADVGVIMPNFPSMGLPLPAIGRVQFSGTSGLINGSEQYTELRSPTKAEIYINNYSDALFLNYADDITIQAINQVPVKVYKSEEISLHYREYIYPIFQIKEGDIIDYQGKQVTISKLGKSFLDYLIWGGQRDVSFVTDEGDTISLNTGEDGKGGATFYRPDSKITVEKLMIDDIVDFKDINGVQYTNIKIQSHPEDLKSYILGADLKRFRKRQSKYDVYV